MEEEAYEEAEEKEEEDEVQVQVRLETSSGPGQCETPEWGVMAELTLVIR